MRYTLKYQIKYKDGTVGTEWKNLFDELTELQHFLEKLLLELEEKEKIVEGLLLNWEMIQ